MAKILVNFLAFLTIISPVPTAWVCILTKIIGLLTLTTAESKIIQKREKGGVTMESGNSGSIPGRSSKRAVVRP